MWGTILTASIPGRIVALRGPTGSVSSMPLRRSRVLHIAMSTRLPRRAAARGKGRCRGGLPDTPFADNENEIEVEEVLGHSWSANIVSPSAMSNTEGRHAVTAPRSRRPDTSGLCQSFTQPAATPGHQSATASGASRL